MAKKNTIIKWVLISVGSVVLVCGIGFLVWANLGYGAEPIALETLDSLDEQGSLETVANLLIMHPENPSDSGIIFYPGARVDVKAYAPLFNGMRERGITCVLVNMPLDLSCFNVNAADTVFEKLPSIKNWYLSGHSMGGIMASNYAGKNKDLVEGLIVLGSYVYSDYPTAQSMTIYGSFNANLEESFDYTDNLVVIEGGDHAKFGNYGLQKGYPVGTITTEEQQRQTIDAMYEFITR